MSDPFAAAKRAAARAAADLVPDGAVVGLGTGSTAAFVLERLAERMRTGLRIRGIPTSDDTARRAEALAIPLVALDRLTGSPPIELTIDGADEVDPQRRLIKGGGGALLREKIVAAASREMVVVVGANKLVERLGAFRVPVEVVEFGWTATARALERLGCRAELRRSAGGDPARSDGGNLLLDCDFGLIDDPAALEARIDAVPGVIECGLFVGLAGRVFVGDVDGAVRVLGDGGGKSGKA